MPPPPRPSPPLPQPPLPLPLLPPTTFPFAQNLKIFISYGREDITNSFAERLYEDLKRTGYTPILDAKDFLLGDSLPARIAGEIAKSDIMILILSRKYSKSQWCSDELNFARKRDKNVIIIKRQEECDLSDEIDFLMRNDLYLAITKDEEYKDKFLQLIKTLGR